MNTDRIVAAVVTRIENPLDGVLPNFTIFGAEFTALWQKLLAGVWALAIVVSVVFLILGILQMGKASVAQNPQGHKEGRTQAVASAISLGGLAALAVIVGAILAIFS